MPRRLTMLFCSMLLFSTYAHAQQSSPEIGLAQETSSASVSRPSDTGTCKTLVPVYDPRRGPVPVRQKYREIEVPAKEAPAGSKCPARGAAEEPPK